MTHDSGKHDNGKLNEAADDDNQRAFICGVVEGFYGRPWTTDQRKDLFRKLKKWGLNSYVYAPKDDYKHRAFWRELYTVEEADHLASLISAAKEHDILFYYALSPGLDMTYSNPKEIQILKRKLEQVTQLGCEAFALLFDDIEPELCKSDKEIFQTFANAQVSVTNEIYTHLNTSKFLFCPTQYCSSRAQPTVRESEYLDTLGTKLNQHIDILWTGNRVITKHITLESIEEITEILRRPPVIWDNLHANDYDQKRVFLGPYSGRSPLLIPHLRGVMTNPNCEFHANTIAIHTLALWSKCRMDAKLDSPISADIRLETENEDDITVDSSIAQNIYHPRLALRNSIAEWLPEFSMRREAFGPISKPQPQVQMVMPIPVPIIPSINTCMSLTTTTTTSTNAGSTVPEVNTAQLHVLADICSTVTTSSTVTPISNPVMNSLVSATKVVTNDDIVNPIPTTVASNIELPKTMPISVMAGPIMETNGTSALTAEVDKADVEDGVADEAVVDDPVVNNLTVENVKMLDEHSQSSNSVSHNEPMECSSSQTSQVSPKHESAKTGANAEDVVMTSVTDLNCMHVESGDSSPLTTSEMQEELLDEKPSPLTELARITSEDLLLLCELFYLPFEHGNRGLKLLTEFNWLKANACVLLSRTANKQPPKPEITEWLQRADDFSTLCGNVQNLVVKIASCENKEICHDLYSYVWDISGALSLLNAYVKWLNLGSFPQNISAYTQGSYTWFTRGWKEAFTCGDQEPWVFRGGLAADLLRLMPIDSGTDLFACKLPELPSVEYLTLRPYAAVDEPQVSRICTLNYLAKFAQVEGVNMELPASLKDIVADCYIGAFVTLNPCLCVLAEGRTNVIVGYVAAALDVQVFHRNIDICWSPEMRLKYPKSLIVDADKDPLTVKQKFDKSISSLVEQLYADCDGTCPSDVSSVYPAVLTSCILSETLTQHEGIEKRLFAILFASLRSSGCFGAHVRLFDQDVDQIQFYQRLGFTELQRDTVAGVGYYGRRF